MATVHYPFQIDYAYDEDGNLLPRLAFALSRPQNPDRRVDIDASVRIKRNLLGRDFFNLLQIGFRERRQVFYVSLEP